MRITIVIPAFNEELRVGKLLKQLQILSYKVVVVDDGSTDMTAKVISKLQITNDKLQILTHKANLGKGEALKTGCDFAFSNGADAVILMDADGQHKHKDIKNLSEVLTTGKYDVVLGSRSFTGNIPLERFLGNKFVSVIINILFGVYVSDVLCGYRGFTINAYKKIRWTTSGYAVEAEMIIRAIKKKLKFGEVEVATVYYDKYKGLSLIDSFGIIFNILMWKIKL